MPHFFYTKHIILINTIQICCTWFLIFPENYELSPSLIVTVSKQKTQLSLEKTFSSNISFPLNSDRYFLCQAHIHTSQPNISKYIQLSRGEICVANFIPPANGVSQGNYFPGGTSSLKQTPVPLTAYSSRIYNTHSGCT